MGASSPTWAQADFLAAADASNLDGGNHDAAECEGKVPRRLNQKVEFSVGSSGTLTSAATVDNLIGLMVARNQMPVIDLREDGLSALPQSLRFYAWDSGLWLPSEDGRVAEDG